MSNRTGMVFQVGISRAKYLDLANMHFIQQNYDAVKEALNAFLDTIDDTSDAASYITECFDKVYEERNNHRKHLEAEIQKAGFLEQSMQGNNGYLQVDVEALHSMKAICWTASQKYGLLYE